MAVVIGYMPFPEFFSMGNNYKYCTISDVFSVLGEPRKVIDTVLELCLFIYLYFVTLHTVLYYIRSWCYIIKDKFHPVFCCVAGCQ